MILQKNKNVSNYVCHSHLKHSLYFKTWKNEYKALNGSLSCVWGCYSAKCWWSLAMVSLFVLVNRVESLQDLVPVDKNLHIQKICTQRLILRPAVVWKYLAHFEQEFWHLYVHTSRFNTLCMVFKLHKEGKYHFKCPFSNWSHQ